MAYPDSQSINHQVKTLHWSIRVWHISQLYPTLINSFKYIRSFHGLKKIAKTYFTHFTNIDPITVAFKKFLKISNLKMIKRKLYWNTSKRPKQINFSYNNLRISVKLNLTSALTITTRQFFHFIEDSAKKRIHWIN